MILVDKTVVEDRVIYVFKENSSPLTTYRKMKWENLKNLKCPSCSSVLGSTLSVAYHCTKCKFSIGKDKFDSIIVSLYKPKKFFSDEDKLSESNNFGYKEVSEDFSDSEVLNNL